MIVRIPKVTKDQVFNLKELTTKEETINWGQQLLGVPDIWIQTRGKGVKVAILDTGIDTDHPDLEDSFISQKDFTGDGIEDTNGHGTHCAGMVGARDNGSGFVGIAPECDLIIGKVLNNNGQGAYQWIADGVDWAVSEGADIISMSLGGPVSDNTLFAAIHRALAKGITVICAAGNEGALLPNNIGYPAQFGSVITVAAHDMNGNPTGFTSRGGELDIMAPGESILSTYVDGGYARLSGTSMATPFVAGLAALILSKHQQSPGNQTPINNCEDLRQHLLRMAAHPGYHDNRTGYGPLTPLRYFGHAQIFESLEADTKAQEVVIEVSGSAPNKILLIDDKRVLKGNGSVSISLSMGQHTLAWIVRGNSGDTYIVEVVEPSNAKDKISKTLDSAGLDAGAVDIIIQ